jgi:hypothetical protein
MTDCQKTSDWSLLLRTCAITPSLGTEDSERPRCYCAFAQKKQQSIRDALKSHLGNIDRVTFDHACEDAMGVETMFSCKR